MATIPASALGLRAGGIDAESIVRALVDAERIPAMRLEARQQALTESQAALAQVSERLGAVRAAAADVVATGAVRMRTQVVPPTAPVVATVQPRAAGAPALAPSALQFSVDQLATHHGLRLGRSVGGPAALVTDRQTLALSSDLAPLGVTAVRVDGATDAGSHTVAVVRGTSGAVRVGTAVAATTTITNGNDQVQLELDGTTETLSIAHGTYDRASLAAAVADAAAAAGHDGVLVDVTSDGALRLMTRREGSDASLRVGGGSALAALGLSADPSAVTGVDGLVRIDGGPEIAITRAGRDEAVTITLPGTGSPNLTLDLSGGLRVGSGTVHVVDTADGSLAAVATAITASAAGVTATAVRQDDGAWMLQLTSQRAGADHLIVTDTAIAGAFARTGGLLQTSEGRDARLTIGSGSGAYSVTASGNVFTDVVPGVTVTATGVTTEPITVGIERDGDASVAAVENLLDTLETALADISALSAYDVDTATAGPLSGSASLRPLAQRLRESISGLATIGVVTERDGSLTLDRKVFDAAVADDPRAVERALGRAGSDSGKVRWTGASSATVPGSYEVQVTSAATRADSGTVLTGGSAHARVVAVRTGGVTATASIAPGSSPTEIADALSHSLAVAGSHVRASVDGNGVRLSAGVLGAAGSFDLTLDLDDEPFTSYTGADVVGTIGGRPAAGVGARLTVSPLDDSPLAGLSIEIEAGAAGALGSVAYTPGAAALLDLVIGDAVSTDGIIGFTGTALERQVDDLTDRLVAFDARLARREEVLTRQWAAVQSMLAGLQSQQEWLGNQIDSFNASRR